MILLESIFKSIIKNFMINQINREILIVIVFVFKMWKKNCRRVLVYDALDPKLWCIFIYKSCLYSCIHVCFFVNESFYSVPAYNFFIMNDMKCHSLDFFPDRAEKRCTTLQRIFRQVPYSMKLYRSFHRTPSPHGCMKMGHA